MNNLHSNDPYLGIQVVGGQAPPTIATGSTVTVTASRARGPHVPGVLVRRFYVIHIAVLSYVIHYHLPIHMLKINKSTDM